MYTKYHVKVNKVLAMELLDKYNNLEFKITSKNNRIAIIDIDYLLYKLKEIEKELKTYKQKEVLNDYSSRL